MSEQTEMTRTDPQEVEGFRSGRRVRPAVDIYDGAAGILLQADLPGVRSEDLNLQLGSDELTIEGRRVFRDGDDDNTFEVVYGRSFKLPNGIDTSKVEANLKHGVLTVTLPRHESLQPRQIQVQAG